MLRALQRQINGFLCACDIRCARRGFDPRILAGLPYLGPGLGISVLALE